jgi:sialic acid synthase SpsE
MDLVRKSLVSKTDIDKGTIIKRDMITIKRPGTGLKPWEIDKIVGKRTKKDIVKDEIFKLDMVK